MESPPPAVFNNKYKTEHSRAICQYDHDHDHNGVFFEVFEEKHPFQKVTYFQLSGSNFQSIAHIYGNFYDDQIDDDGNDDDGDCDS